MKVGVLPGSAGLKESSVGPLVTEAVRGFCLPSTNDGRLLEGQNPVVIVEWLGEGTDNCRAFTLVSEPARRWLLKLWGDGLVPQTSCAGGGSPLWIWVCGLLRDRDEGSTA